MEEHNLFWFRVVIRVELFSYWLIPFEANYIATLPWGWERGLQVSAKNRSTICVPGINYMRMLVSSLDYIKHNYTSGDGDL
jgi:hypothetical protein